MKCCDLTAGKLRHQITIEREQPVSDGAGGSYLTWATVATPRAFVDPMSGGERLQAMRLEATITHRIYIRYRDDIRTGDRINFDGRLMQIRAPIDLEERNRWLEIHADEGVAT